MDLIHYIYQIFYHWGQTDDIQTEQKRMSEFMPKEVNQNMLEDTDIEAQHAHETRKTTSKFNAFNFDHRLQRRAEAVVKG